MHGGPNIFEPNNQEPQRSYALLKRVKGLQIVLLNLIMVFFFVYIIHTF